ncbi:MAG: ABC transporter ATP-binding protein [Bacteroidales bacterium]|nr:MAG: ABC transporter ATP-binding protein [Bacteroidales bacterium]
MNSSENILSIENLIIGYGSAGSKGKPVFSDIKLKAKKGENIAVIGRNGIGKSTLLRTISRLQKPLKGNIRIKDKDISHYTKQEFARIVSFVSTEIIRISNFRLIDLVALGRFPYTGWIGKPGRDDYDIINESISQVGIDDLKYKLVNEVSDGERQRAMIARALAQDTEIIILDEPTAFLDMPSKYEIIRLLNELTVNRNKTIIFSSHDLNITLQEADKIWLMEADEIVEGAPEDMILNRNIYNLFDNSNMSFNIESGDFRLNRNITGKIMLNGKGIAEYWTRRALERLGFEISDETGQELFVQVDDNKKPTEWILMKKGNKIKTNSIYNLTLHLRDII